MKISGDFDKMHDKELREFIKAQLESLPDLSKMPLEYQEAYRYVEIEKQVEEEFETMTIADMEENPDDNNRESLEGDYSPDSDSLYDCMLDRQELIVMDSQSLLMKIDLKDYKNVEAHTTIFKNDLDALLLIDGKPLETDEHNKFYSMLIHRQEAFMKAVQDMRFSCEPHNTMAKNSYSRILKDALHCYHTIGSLYIEYVEED